MSDIPWTATSDAFDELWEDHVPALEGVPDTLATMMTQQAKHMREYAEMQHTTPRIEEHDWGNLDLPLVQAKLRESAGYMVEELYEAIGHLKNKPWKQSFKEVDRDAFREEVSDATHFFLEFLILAGISPEQLFIEYFRKTLINEHRRATGY
ncbi:dUTPase [Gordonia phage Margaret]|nr:dUTPase [Gordonia phage Margaret]